VRLRGPILLIEDDANDVLLVQRALRRAELDVDLRVVRDAREAIAYLEGTGAYSDRDAHPLPALVLLDLKMPAKSGFEVLAWARAQPGIRRLPLVVLTSSRAADDVARAYDAGASSYLVKPVAFDELRAMLRALAEYWLGVNVAPGLEG
jgi:CheY-like chemotaxis protein